MAVSFLINGGIEIIYKKILFTIMEAYSHNIRYKYSLLSRRIIQYIPIFLTIYNPIVIGCV